MQFQQTVRMVRSAVDDVGMSFGVDRLRNETGYQYVERIYDRYKNPANHSYDGVASKVARKLGLMNAHPFEIYRIPFYGPTDIDDITVTVLEDALTDTSLSLDDDELVGMTLEISGVSFEIIENTSDTIYVGTNYLQYIYDKTLQPTYSIYKSANPFVTITSSRLRIYSSYLNESINVLDVEIDLNDSTTLLDVIDSINTLSQNFSCRQLPIRRYRSEVFMSRNIIPQTSLVNANVFGNGTKFLDLGFTNILEDSLGTNFPGRLVNKKNSIQSITSSGDYFLDRFSGFLYAYEDIPITMNVTFRANQFPFRPKCSLIIIDDIRDAEYQRLLFRQVEQQIYSDPNNRDKNGKPLDQFFIDYRLLNSLNNIHWGE